MTKQDYELIARVIREAGEDSVTAVHPNVIDRFADELDETNPRFDRERFISACYGEDSYDSAGRKVRYSTR